MSSTPATTAKTNTPTSYDLGAALRLLWSLITPYKGLVTASCLLLLCNIVGMLFIPTELSALVNTAIGSHDSAELLYHGTRMLIAALAGSLGCIASYWCCSKLAANVGRDLRVRLYQHSLILASSDFEQFGTASMVTRTLSDANVVQQMLLMSFIMLAPVPIICVVSIVLSWRIDPIMGQVILWLTFALMIVSAIAVKKTTPIFMLLQTYIDRMNVRLRESITGVRVIRAFGKETHEEKRLDETFEDYAHNAIRANLIFAITDVTSFFFMNVVEATIMWFGADRVGVGAMQIGSITALVQYAITILFSLMMAQFALLMLPRAFACLTRAYEVLTCQPEISDPADPQALDTGKGEVARFAHASFRFADASEDTLHDLDFTIPRGKTTAIIGNTGSGKSTIAKLLLRIHDVSSGELTIFGTDIRTITQADLRSQIAYVPQKAWLFSGTIAENLRQGKPDASDEELWRALEIAQASFMRDLPDGLESHVAQGGSNFSGGQRQRLAIARALVRPASLYIFDDSFSALDYKTDAALRAALARELENAAILIIAQRVSTIRNAEQIIVLKDGEITGRGTHEELLETCPTYQQIFESQTRGGGEGDVSGQ